MYSTICKICALYNTAGIKKTGTREDIYSVHALENSIKLHFVETADYFEASTYFHPALSHSLSFLSSYVALCLAPSRCLVFTE